jgi:hypothetical protein
MEYGYLYILIWSFLLYIKYYTYITLGCPLSILFLSDKFLETGDPNFLIIKFELSISQESKRKRWR